MAIDFPVDDDDFGAMLEESLSRKRRTFSIGEKVKAKVVQVGAERLLLDLGDGQDAMIELDQWDAGDFPDLAEGDSLDAYVLGFDERVAELGLAPGRGAAGRLGLEQAHASGLPVAGTVAEVNKGGYVVDVSGTRCFCPMGAMDVRRIEDPTTLIGQRLQFRVTEMKGTRDVVLSRRAVLEAENTRKATETRERLAVGERFRGPVVAVREFGAFVDLGGIEGLVPASEIGHARGRPADAVALGLLVDVEVIAMGPGPDGRERITLSMKALQDDPFLPVTSHLAVGTVLAGTVTRVQPFGAFVELAPGVEGLIHVSAFGRRIGHPSEAVKPGQTVAVRVEGLDPEARRISLQLADESELVGDAKEAGPLGLRILRGPALLRAEQWDEPKPVEGNAVADADASRPPASRPPAPAAVAPPRVGDVFEVSVDKPETFGVFVSWPSGRGLVPGRELGLPRGADLKRQFPVGTKFQAAVIDIRPDGKIALSQTAVGRAQERADAEAYAQAPGASGGKGLGTLGEMLAAKKRR